MTTGEGDLRAARRAYRGQQVTGDFHGELVIGNTRFVKDRDLRYGENPGQPAVFYREIDARGPSLGTYEVLQENPDRMMGFINFLDVGRGIQLISRMRQLYPQQAISTVIKHVNPSGVAKADSLLKAYRDAWNCDALSAFGGVVGFSDTVDHRIAREVSSNFIEVLVAPNYTTTALDELRRRRDLRVIKVESFDKPLVDDGLDYRRVPGGLLVQQRFVSAIDSVENFECVSKRQPTQEELEAALFNWAILPYVWSNTIVIGDQNKTIGIGRGQPSRIDSAELAVKYANERSKQGARGHIMASDAFFPATDVAELAGKQGITAIAYPLGSIKDAEVIETADKYDISMLATRPEPGNTSRIERAFSH